MATYFYDRQVSICRNGEEDSRLGTSRTVDARAQWEQQHRMNSMLYPARAKKDAQQKAVQVLERQEEEREKRRQEKCTQLPLRSIAALAGSKSFGRALEQAPPQAPRGRDFHWHLHEVHDSSWPHGVLPSGLADVFGFLLPFGNVVPGKRMTAWVRRAPKCPELESSEDETSKSPSHTETATGEEEPGQPEPHRVENEELRETGSESSRKMTGENSASELSASDLSPVIFREDSEPVCLRECLVHRESHAAAEEPHIWHLPLDVPNIPGANVHRSHLCL
eukprot:Skav213663  [mRNA]  locus=scaffold2012:486626:492160:- [translate_table: standard]